jgi:streptogramin lyase
LKKNEQLAKKISSVVLSIILIGLITSLLISYFFNPQIEYIRIDYNPIFAINQNPSNVAADNAGNVYVVDAETDRVQKFTTNGTFVKEWDIHRTTASELFPSGIAADNAGNVYVVDAETDRVQKFTTNGTFVKEHFLPMD